MNARIDFHDKKSLSADQQILLKELQLKIALRVEGLSFDPEELKTLPIGTEFAEQVHLLFDMDKEHHDGFELPSIFWLPQGLQVAFRWDPDSRYRLRVKNGQASIEYWGNKGVKELGNISFYPRPRFNDYATSDGEHFDHVAAFSPEGGVQVFFSNECDLKHTGEDCKYCNINSTADAYRSQNIFLKSPGQVGEVYAAAFKEGKANHINLTGGFIPERREVDYYLDIAEEIKERTGQHEIYGTAVIGAPLDLAVIDKYKEAGYKTLAINLEVWNKEIFKAICPGKDRRSGGWAHWVKALEYAAQVFGHGRVRSNIVAGIEPKDSILEGVEHLASKGVIAFAGAWCPNPGSALEGHRSPEPSWHYDLTLKVAAIYRKHGFTTEQLYAGLGNSSPFHDAFRILNGENTGPFLPQYTHPVLEVQPAPALV